MSMAKGCAFPHPLCQHCYYLALVINASPPWDLGNEESGQIQASPAL